MKFLNRLFYSIFSINIPIENSDPATMVASDYDKSILYFCKKEKTSNEIIKHLQLKNKEYFRKNILKPLIQRKKILLTIPDKARSKNQKYITNTNIKGK